MKRLWLPALLLAACACAQHGGPFSCVGRPGGYYADQETNCQLYHLCDESGRKFTLSCPNNTLFNQRMLVCDHWYSVDCKETILEPSLESAVLPQRSSSRHSTVVLKQNDSHPNFKEDKMLYSTTPIILQVNSEKTQKYRDYQAKLSNPAGDKIIPVTVQRTNERHNEASRNRQVFVTRSRSSISNPISKISFTSVTERLDDDNYHTNSYPNTVNNSNLSEVSPKNYVRRKYSKFIDNTETLQDSIVKPILAQPSTDGSNNQPTEILRAKTKDEFLQFVPNSEQATESFVQQNKNNLFTPELPQYLSEPIKITKEKTIYSEIHNHQERENYEDEVIENKIELYLMDPRKMFYIGDNPVDKNRTVLIISLPQQEQIRFKSKPFSLHYGSNPDCPFCMPEFLVPGTCTPCVRMR